MQVDKAEDLSPFRRLGLPMTKGQNDGEDGVSTQAGEDGCSEIESVNVSPSSVMLPNFGGNGECQGFLERKSLSKMLSRWSLQYVMLRDGQLSRFDAVPGVKWNVKTVDLAAAGIMIEVHWKVFVLKGTPGGEEDAEYRICNCSKPLNSEVWGKSLKAQQKVTEVLENNSNASNPSSSGGLSPEMSITFPVNRTSEDGEGCQGLLERNPVSGVFDSWQLQYVIVRDGKLTRFDVGAGTPMKITTVDLTVSTVTIEIWNKAFVLRGTSKGQEDATFRICGCSQPLGSHHFAKAIQAQKSKA